MITVLTTNVTMPLWLFLLLCGAGVALNAFLMWCNHDQASTIRRQKRRELREKANQDPSFLQKALDGGDR